MTDDTPNIDFISGSILDPSGNPYVLYDPYEGDSKSENKSSLDYVSVGPTKAREMVVGRKTWSS